MDKITTSIRKERGAWEWFIMRGKSRVMGGWGRTKAAAKNDMKICLTKLT